MQKTADRARLGLRIINMLRRGGAAVSNAADDVVKGIRGAPKAFSQRIGRARGAAQAKYTSDAVSAFRANPELRSEFMGARELAHSKAQRLAELEHQFAASGKNMDNGLYRELKALRKEMKGGESAYLNRTREDIVNRLTEGLENKARGLEGAERAAVENQLRGVRNLGPRLHERGLASAPAWRRYGGKAFAAADPVFIGMDVGEGIDNIREGNYGDAAMNFGRAALFMPFLRHFPGGHLNGLVRPFERARTMRGPVGMLARNSGKLLGADFAYQIASPYFGSGEDAAIPDANDFDKINQNAHKAQGSGGWDDLTPTQRGDLIRRVLSDYMDEYNSTL